MSTPVYRVADNDKASPPLPCHQGYIGRGFSKTINKTNATKQIIPSHHGLKGMGNKITMTHHQGGTAFDVSLGSNFNSP